jgi:hypothetical protein
MLQYPPTLGGISLRRQGHGKTTSGHFGPIS